jgi:hypothetical protein
VRDVDQLPALREVGQDCLFECSALLHQEASEIEGLVVTGELLIRGEAVDRRVLLEPVDQQVVAAPVAQLASSDPVEPVEIRSRIARQTVVAQHDGVAADRDR